MLSRRYLHLCQKRCPEQVTEAELDWHSVMYSLLRISWAASNAADQAGKEPMAEDTNLAGLATDGRSRELPLHARIINQITGVSIETKAN